MAKLRKGERLSRRLESVVARLCEKLGPMTTTRAVKLPYLVDVEAAHYLGHRITDGTHETWDHGVVTSEVWSFIQNGGDVHGPFEISPHSFSEGGKQISLVGEPDDELADFASGSLRRRVEEPEAETERQARKPEHAAELAAADARDERQRDGSGASSTDCVCWARYAARRE